MREGIMHTTFKRWTAMKAVARKKLKRNPVEFCRRLLAWDEHGACGEVRAAFVSALTSSRAHSVSISSILHYTGWSLDTLARTAVCADVPIGQIQGACDDALALDLVQAMRVVNRAEGGQGLHTKCREDRHPYVLTQAFITEVAHSGAA